jgi:acyl carrier protein
MSDHDVDTVRVASSASYVPTVTQTREMTALKLGQVSAEICARDDMQLQAFISGHDMTLQATGIDSISVIHLSKEIKHDFNAELSLNALNGGATFRRLAEIINQIKNGKKELRI